MKAFPTEALTHTPISAVLDLVKDNDLRPDDVEKIQIRSLTRASDILADPSRYDPHTKETAEHSLPYVIAAALVDRQVTPLQFTMEKIMDPKIREQLKQSRSCSRSRDRESVSGLAEGNRANPDQRRTLAPKAT
jgi:2-methylcitrate dehydratase